jgi:hypothetical protein
MISKYDQYITNKIMMYTCNVNICYILFLNVRHLFNLNLNNILIIYYITSQNYYKNLFDVIVL